MPEIGLTDGIYIWNILTHVLRVTLARFVCLFGSSLIFLNFLIAIITLSIFSIFSKHFKHVFYQLARTMEFNIHIYKKAFKLQASTFTAVSCSVFGVYSTHDYLIGTPLRTLVLSDGFQSELTWQTSLVSPT